MGKQAPPSLEAATAIIRRFAKSLPDTPGVYRMLDDKGQVLYVGKAKSLTKRVMSYTNTAKMPYRLQRMVSQTVDMEFVHTHTEADALLLEASLIKKLKPHFNILLRDDKSFPYILIARDHEFPLVAKYRGSQKRKGDYFGPFPGAGAVNRTIATLQKAFMLRNCSDNVFASRTRPCLQYHIKRCTAPCVGFVSVEEYAEQVDFARDFLSGKSKAVHEYFSRKMQQASDAREYEEAAKYRDRLKALSHVSAQQQVHVDNLGDADLFAIYQKDGVSCIQVFFFRNGQNNGNQSYFPACSDDESEEDIIAAFIGQFYQNKPVPSQILVNVTPSGKGVLEDALEVQSGHRVHISKPLRGARKKIVGFAVSNAKDALKQKLIKNTSEKRLLTKVAGLFDLEDLPKRIEIYDNSHISGTNMVGAMVVAGPEGFQKNAYRKFNIKQADAADDYGMMREVLRRRFGRSLKDGSGPESADWPDLVLLDGGKGQLSAALEVVRELGLEDSLCLVAISKGVDRNAGREVFHPLGQPSFDLPVDDPVLHYMQRLRDEAHRFAIGAHRTRRMNAISKSLLDDVPGVGAKRKKALLHYFGSAKSVAGAGVQDLQQVEGISEAMAQRIYDYFH